MGVYTYNCSVDDVSYDIAYIRVEVQEMNKQMLFGLPMGTRVRIGDKEGVLTNASAMEIFKTYEITFDDGKVITRDELVDKDKEEWDLVPHDDYVETLKKRDWYKSEMEDLQKKLKNQTKTMQAMEKEKKQDDEKIDKILENQKKEIVLVKNLQERLGNAVDKVQDMTVENVTLTKRLEELTGSESIVIEKGEMTDGPHKFKGVGFVSEDKFTDEVLPETPPFDHSPDVHSSGPVGAPVKLATEIAKLLNKENVGKILKESGGHASIKMIADKLDSSAKAVYRFLKKTPGFSVGKLPEPDYKEENADAWLEGQQKVEPEVADDADATVVDDDPGTSEESGNAPKDEGDQEGSEDVEGGDNGSS